MVKDFFKRSTLANGSSQDPRVPGSQLRRDFTRRWIEPRGRPSRVSSSAVHNSSISCGESIIGLSCARTVTRRKLRGRVRPDARRSSIYAGEETEITDYRCSLSDISMRSAMSFPIFWNKPCTPLSPKKFSAKLFTYPIHRREKRERQEKE